MNHFFIEKLFIYLIILNRVSIIQLFCLTCCQFHFEHLTYQTQ